jgi:hypothetical protein
MQPLYHRLFTIYDSVYVLQTAQSTDPPATRRDIDRGGLNKIQPECQLFTPRGMSIYLASYNPSPRGKRAENSG